MHDENATGTYCRPDKGYFSRKRAKTAGFGRFYRYDEIVYFADRKRHGEPYRRNDRATGKGIESEDHSGLGGLSAKLRTNAPTLLKISFASWGVYLFSTCIVGFRHASFTEFIVARIFLYSGS